MTKLLLRLAGAPLLVVTLVATACPIASADPAGSTTSDTSADIDSDRGPGLNLDASSTDDFAIKGDFQKEIEQAKPVDLSGYVIAETIDLPGYQIAEATQGDQGGGDVFSNADEAARQSSNPLGGDFMILLNQWNVDFQDGDLTDETRHAFTHIFQPVMPIGLGGDWISVTRPTLPIIYSAELPSGPDLSRPGKASFDSESGFGDLIMFSLVGTSTGTDFLGGGDRVLAGGFTSMFPTGSSEFTTGQYSLGPAAVAAFIGKKYIFGALGQHWLDVAEDVDNAPNINRSNIQVFYYKNFPGGWQIGGAPQIEVDWDGDDGWAVPVGLGIQKTQIMFGKMPVKFGVEAQYYVVDRKNLGNEWRIQFTIAPIIPNFIGNLLK